MIVPILALAILAPQKLQLDVNAKDGVVVTGERVFRVTVQSKAPVTQVEFYVNDELRETDTSTPYEFKVDSLSESEGSMKVKFSAYNTEGQSASRVLNVRIDNLSGMSPDEHIAKGRDLLTVSKWDEAILRGRIANKAKPNYAPALILLGRGYLGKGVLDSAQKFAEDAVAADPNSIEAAELLAYVNLQKAFNTFNRGGDRKETLGVIRTALKTAVETRTRLLAQAFEKMGPQTDSGMLAWSDAAMKAGRFQTAVNVLQPAFTKDNRRNDVGNRLAYAYLRMGRIADAYSTLDATKKYGTLDAYGYALLAITEAERGNAAASDDASWTRERAGDLAQTVQEGASTASPWVRATADGVSARLLQLSAEAKEIAGRQSEHVAFLAIRLNAQAKGEIDALKRAAREGRLTPQWHKVAGVAYFRNGGSNVHETGEGPSMPAGGSAPEGELATRQSHDRTSRNALIPVEPWRCRLPVVRSDSLVDQVLMGAVRRAPTEASRSS